MKLGNVRRLLFQPVESSMIPCVTNEDDITIVLLSTIQKIAENLLDLAEEVVMEQDDHYISPQNRAELKACFCVIKTMSPPEALLQLRTSIHLWDGPRAGMAIRLQLQYAENLHVLMGAHK